MKKSLVTATLIAAGTFALSVQADTGKKLDAKAEFQEHCASCHPDGGNIVNKAKSLTKEDRTANGIKGWKDIVAKMRNPGPGMTKFDKKQIPDKEAKAIAEYILKTFK
jgi:cytochrome c6